MNLVKRGMPGLPEKYQGMLEEITNYLPVVERGISNFNKAQSQFMDTMLTVHQPTELRSARQCLAEINNAMLALGESSFKLRKKKLELKEKEHQRHTFQSDNNDLLDIEIEEIVTGLNISQGLIEATIRRILNYMDMYKAILAKYGKEEFTEEDFEKDEERYHIMTAFTQALCAARSHDGRVDEGNQIYFHQIGINGTQAQMEVTSYLQSELEIFRTTGFIPHFMTVEWLNRMANKFEGCAQTYAHSMNKTLINKKALNSSNGEGD